MEIEGKKVMVLGGWGLVGMAICRQILDENPRELVVLSLTESEAKEAYEILRATQKTDAVITPQWGT